MNRTDLLVNPSTNPSNNTSTSSKGRSKEGIRGIDLQGRIGRSPRTARRAFRHGPGITTTPGADYETGVAIQQHPRFHPLSPLRATGNDTPAASSSSSIEVATCGQSSFLFHRFPMDHGCLLADPSSSSTEPVERVPSREVRSRESATFLLGESQLCCSRDGQKCVCSLRLRFLPSSIPPPPPSVRIIAFTRVFDPSCLMITNK